MNIATQCCGIILVVIIIYSYCVQKKIELYTAVSFIGLCSVTLMSLLLDAVSIAAIHNSKTLPLIFVEIICKMYVSSTIWVAAFGLRYTLVDIYKTNRLNMKCRLITFLVGVGGSIPIYILPIKMFHGGSSEVYTYGPSVITTYMLVVGILVAIGILLGSHWNRVTPQRRSVIASWVLIWIIAAVIQFFNNELLLVGYANAIGVLLIYLSLENPARNIDHSTGLFNVGAFSRYMFQLQSEKKDVSIIKLEGLFGTQRGIRGIEQEEVQREVVQFVIGLPRTSVFRMSRDECFLVVETEEQAWENIRTIEARYAKPWGKDALRMITPEWLMIPTTEMLYFSEDIQQVFQYGRARGGRRNDKGIVIDSDMIRELHEEHHMEEEIVNAMQEGRIEVFYQPIYAVKEDVFHSAEALVRIRDKDGGIVPPGKFIPVAEAKGLIIKLGEMVFDQVCRFIVEEKPYRYGLKYIEVNLSVIQCAYENLADDFIAIMDRYQIDSQYLVLEITESASIEDKKVLLKNMEKLKARGVRFALDDFGTGQSNLNYIVEMPVDVVKFDNTMTCAYFENGTAKHVMDAAMKMIQGMNLPIVSEGIEEKSQYTAMADLGIDFIQGYYFSRPIEREEFLKFIKEKHEKQQTG